MNDTVSVFDWNTLHGHQWKNRECIIIRIQNFSFQLESFIKGCNYSYEIGSLDYPKIIPENIKTIIQKEFLLKKLSDNIRHTAIIFTPDGSEFQIIK